MNELNAFNLGFWLPDFSIFVLILNVAFGLWTVHQNRKKARKHVKISFKKEFQWHEILPKKYAWCIFRVHSCGKWPKHLQIARSPPTKFHRLMTGILWQLTHHVELANVKFVCRNFKKLCLGIMQKIEEILINTNEWRSS